jgi:RNA polymerase sigma factor (sigma-70 family)
MATKGTAAMADPDSFDAFFESTWPELFRALLVVAADRELAADAAAEAFTRAWQSWGRLQNPRAWTWKVAQNCLRSSARRIRSREVLTDMVDERLEVTAQVMAAAAPAAADIDMELLKAVADLPAQQRAVVAGRHLLGLRPWEVAHALEISPSTESEHHRRAMDTLRNRLADWEGYAS